MPKPHDPTPIYEKTNQLLSEVRVILPGTQALLGFQFTAFFSNGFEGIPRELEIVHFASLVCILSATAFLMATVTIHQITESGKNIPRFHDRAGKFLVAGMAFLAVGLSLDVGVVGSITFGSFLVGILTAFASFFILLGLWFGYSIYRKEDY